MKKSRLIILSFISLLILINFVAAQLESVDAEGILDTWKGWLINTINFIGSATNSICENGNWFFRPLMGSECSMNLSFALAFVFWIVLVFLLCDIIASYSSFSNLTSFVIGFALAVIFANFGIISFISELIVAAVTTPAGILAVAAVIIAILIIYIVLKSITTAEKKRKKEAEVEQSKKEVVEISKAFGKGINQ